MNNDALNSKNKSNQDNIALFSIVDELQQILNYANKNLIKKQKEKNEEINLDEENLEEDEIEEKFSVYNQGGLGEKAQKKETGLLGKKGKNQKYLMKLRMKKKIKSTIKWEDDQIKENIKKIVIIKMK